jgi:hypothetical protein
LAFPFRTTNTRAFFVGCRARGVVTKRKPQAVYECLGFGGVCCN